MPNIEVQQEIALSWKQGNVKPEQFQSLGRSPVHRLENSELGIGKGCVPRAAA